MMYGDQIPRIMSVPDYASSCGQEAVELAAYAGLKLDPWQQLVLHKGMGEKRDGDWAAFEVAVVVSRQNGKGAIIEARELAGLFLLGERLIIHTSHEFKTTQEAFGRIRTLIENTDDLRRKVKRIITSHGSECIELLNGQRLRFLARSKGSGRGFSCDCLFLDESMILGADSMAALLPTMSARENPQVWYLGSAGVGEKSTQLAAIRQRGLDGGDKSLAYFEWSTEIHNDYCLSSCQEHRTIGNANGWLQANPGVGYRISLDYIAKERTALGPAMFARERLAVGDYPDVTMGNSPISLQQWVKLSDPKSLPGKDLVFGVDVSDKREYSSIVAYSVRPDGVGHAEIIDRRYGTDWIPERLVELKARWNPMAIALDGKGPIASLLVDLDTLGICRPTLTNKDHSERPRRGDLFVASTIDMAAACGQLADAVKQGAFVHLGDEPFTSAVGGASARPMLDSWAWTRRKSAVDISPLVALTLARYCYYYWYEYVMDYSVLASAW